MRVGVGYDVHSLVPGESLVLGGVTIDYHIGLLGHSDADVLTHAIMDALLGALALGDIGEHFPPGHEQWRDVSSLSLLERVMDLITLEGFEVGNLDTVIMAQRPKLAPYLLSMRENLSLVLGIRVQEMSIKATTTEGLGFVGREEGIAAQAVVLVKKKGDEE